ncbi:hypothetical protein BDU57DRAFT_321280 [Ampelomyces quisqualis]|uniref:Uncharacterized protein n=1 Tax=Ampelomyces quisqualis TaxID=50730 RepID=A0A6A5QDR4_AMPQU|nr:hypothetical protein BDU57DRAFT_321280 [Ampelomyces quisqualis]
MEIHGALEHGQRRGRSNLFRPSFKHPISIYTMASSPHQSKLKGHVTFKNLGTSRHMHPFVRCYSLTPVAGELGSEWLQAGVEMRENWQVCVSGKVLWQLSNQRRGEGLLLPGAAPPRSTGHWFRTLPNSNYRGPRVLWRWCSLFGTVVVAVFPLNFGALGLLRLPMWRRSPEPLPQAGRAVAVRADMQFQRWFLSLPT